MFGTGWYYAMITIIIATSIYQNIWLKEHKIKLAKPTTLSQRVLGLILLVPVLNTFYGIMAFSLLLMYTFLSEEFIEKSLLKDGKFVKIDSPKLKKEEDYIHY